MSKSPRIYLDNAATSWPKPEAVYQAVDRYQRQSGAPAGRSAYREAVEVQQQVNEARRRLARLLGADEPRRIIFTFNGTDSLNMALYGLLGPGDHVVTTIVEHNSVLRPLRALEATRGVSVSYVPCDSRGVIDPDEVRAALGPRTKLVAVIHASNVTGALQPVAEVARIAREAGARVLVDAAQSLGHLPIDVAEFGIDLLAAPGHKGLLGPLGTGVLYIGPGMEQQLASYRQGGTGTASEEDQQPQTLPDKYESGNHNVPGIVGLGAGLEYLWRHGLAEIRQHEIALIDRLLEGIRDIPNVSVLGPERASDRVGVVSLNIAGYDPHEVASLLDASYAIQTRAGIHCAPRVHEALGTLHCSGTVRLSTGPLNTLAEIEMAVQAIGEIAASAIKV